MPVEVNVSSTLGDVDLKTLSWDELKGMRDDNNLFKVLAMEVTDFKCKNATSLPPAMLNTSLACQMKDPASLAITFLDAMQVMIWSTKTITCKTKIWGWVLPSDPILLVGRKQPLTYSNSEEAEVLDWCEKMHEIPRMPLKITIKIAQEQTKIYLIYEKW